MAPIKFTDKESNMHQIATKAFQICVGCSCASVCLGYFDTVELFVASAAVAVAWPLVTHGCDYVSDPPAFRVDARSQQSSNDHLADVVSISIAATDHDEERAA